MLEEKVALEVLAKLYRLGWVRVCRPNARKSILYAYPEQDNARPIRPERYWTAGKPGTIVLLRWQQPGGGLDEAVLFKIDLLAPSDLPEYCEALLFRQRAVKVYLGYEGTDEDEEKRCWRAMFFLEESLA